MNEEGIKKRKIKRWEYKQKEEEKETKESDKIKRQE